MAAIERLEFKSEGFRRILRSQGAVAMTHEQAKQLAARAQASSGAEGFEVRASVGANRARSVVITTTPEAMAAEAEGKALTRALGGR